MGNIEYAYVTNNIGDNRDWPKCGNTFNVSAIFGPHKSKNRFGPHKSNTDTLQEGFRKGDVLVRYGNGKAVTIIQNRQKNAEEGMVRYGVRALKEEERERHAKSFQHLERELRYQKNSYVWKRHKVEKLLEKHDTLALVNIITSIAKDKYLNQLASTALISLGYVEIILPMRYDLLEGGHKAYKMNHDMELVGANDEEELADSK